MLCAMWSELVSFFLWHLTWGWYQLSMHILFLWFFLIIVIPMGLLRAGIYSLLLHIATSVWVCFLVYFLTVYVCHMPFASVDQYGVVYTHLYKVTLSFAVVYNVCVYLTALLLYAIMPIPRGRLIVALFLSGITSGLLVTHFISFG